MSLFDDLKKKYTQMLNPVKQSLNDNQGWFQQGKFTPAAGIKQTQERARQSPITNIGPIVVPNFQNNQVLSNQVNQPRLQLPQLNTKNKAVNFAGNYLVKPVVESTLNIPRNLSTGYARIYKEVGDAKDQNRKLSTSNLLSGALPLVEGAFDFATMGLTSVGKNMVKAAAKDVAKEGILKVIGKGALTGGILGGIGGSSYSIDSQYGKDIKAGDVALQGLAGIVIGGTLGGLITGSSAAWTKNVERISRKIIGLKPKITQQEAEKEAIKFLRNDLGQYVGKNPLYKSPEEIKFVGDLRESLGADRYGPPQIGQGIRRITTEETKLKPATLASKERLGSVPKLTGVSDIPKVSQDILPSQPIKTGGVETNPSEVIRPKLSKSEIQGQPARQGYEVDSSSSLQKQDQVLPWEKGLTRDTQLESVLPESKQLVSQPQILSKEKQITPQSATTSRHVPSIDSIPPNEVKNIQRLASEKVSAIDYLRTPDRVLKKIGLEKESETLKNAYNNYLDQLPVEINKITNWYDQVKSDPTASQRIFKLLDGQDVKLSAKELKVAEEMKTYLKEWADKLDLPYDKRVSNYITHIFEKDFIKKDFDEDLAKIIAEKIPGSVYDPFTQQRLGKSGYIEDVFKALDAYVKRATRKANMDPALEAISNKSSSLPLESWKYVKSYVDRVNLRPTEVDTLLDNWVKQSRIGYKFGQRPVTAVSRKIRQTVYRGTLGLNIGSAVRNLTQGVNTYAKLGERWTANGYFNAFKSLFSKGGELERVGVLRDTNIQDRQLSAVKGLLQKLDDGLFVFFNFAERINRGSAYFGAKARALSKGFSEEQAVKEGIKMARDTQFTFGSVDTPLIMSSDLVKTIGQFQSFNIKQTEFLGEMVKKKEFVGMTRWLGANILIMATVGKLFGYDLKDMVPFSGIITGDSKLGETPAIKLVESIGGAIANTPDKYGQPRDTKEKMSDILNNVVPLIPAGVQIKKTIEGVKAVNQEGSFSKAGLLQYPVEKTPENYIKAGTFGKSNLPSAQEYNFTKQTPLSEKQTAGYKASTDKQEFYKKTINSRELNANLKGEGYYTSEDAPKNELQKAIVFGKSVITDPKLLIEAKLQGNPVRKVENGYVVLERKQGLNQLDSGNKGTEVDHIVPLEFGGTNPKKTNKEIIEETTGMSLTERNAYLKQYGLEVLPKAEHAIKTKVQNYLSDELSAKRITKKEASQRILNWRDEIKNLSASIQEKLVKEVVAAEPVITDKTYTITNVKTGKDTTIDLSTPIKPYVPTGQTELDKLNKSEYTSSVNKRVKDIKKVWDAGLITAEEAEKLIASTKAKKVTVKKAKKAKKPKKITLKKPKLIKIKMPKIKRIKFKKPKKVKLIVKKVTVPKIA